MPHYPHPVMVLLGYVSSVQISWHIQQRQRSLSCWAPGVRAVCALSWSHIPPLLLPLPSLSMKSQHLLAEILQPHLPPLCSSFSVFYVLCNSRWIFGGLKTDKKRKGDSRLVEGEGDNKTYLSFIYPQALLILCKGNFVAFLFEPAKF